MSFIDELEDKVLNQPKFSRIYLKNYLSVYVLSSDYSTVVSKMIEAKCRTKDQVELIMDCLHKNGGNYISYLGTVLYRFFFEEKTWVIPGDHNPFLE